MTNPYPAQGLWPPGWPACRFHGAVIDSNGRTYPRPRLRIQPAVAGVGGGAAIIRMAGSSTVVVPAPMDIPIAPDGRFDVLIPASDVPTTPSGWAWNLHFRPDVSSDSDEEVWATFRAPAGGQVSFAEALHAAAHRPFVTVQEVVSSDAPPPVNPTGGFIDPADPDVWVVPVGGT